MPLSLDPVDRIGLNLRKVRTREKVQAWLDSDPEEQGLPITPEYNAAASTIEIDDPEASDLAPTPENNSVNDIAIAELAVNDDQTGEQVQPKNQLISALNVSSAVTHWYQEARGGRVGATQLAVYDRGNA